MNMNPESKRFLKRSILCAAGVLIFFLLLLSRLVYLQVIKNSFYATLSKRNVISIVPVQPNRGIIYDRNGVVLAKNIPVYSLTVIPARVKNMKTTIKSLRKIVNLTPQDIQNFDRIVKQYYPYQSVPLKQQLTEEEVDQFYVNQYHFPGVSVQVNLIRNYPLGKATSDVVGYVGRITTAELAQVDPGNYSASDNIGKAGVEAEDETLLHGVMGSEEAEIDANGKIVRVLKTTPPVPGDNIYLTIDSQLQQYAEKLLGKQTGAIVAIQPTTGQVLALVTKPTYDPNMFVKGMTNKQYHALMNNPDHPLFNRATRATYAPGSAIKPFIAFGALNDGVIDTQDYIFDPGWFRVPHTKHIFHNWVKKGFGWVNVVKSITVSCDTFFYQLATALGIDRLDQALTQFGFGSLTGINLPLETPGVVPSPAWKMKHIGEPWYEGDTVLAGIGQGYILVTPIQLAAATATISEHGVRFQPNILLKLQQPNGKMTTIAPIQEKPIIEKTPHSFSTVIEGMQDVISDPEGTAHNSFQQINYTAAGKTGTAQVAADNASGTVTQTGTRFQNNHLFIVFAPVNHPQIAVAVVLEHIHGMTQKAVQIGRQLLDFYINELQQQQQLQQQENANLPTIPEPTSSTNNNTTTNNTSLPAPQTQNTNASPTLPSPQNLKTIKQELNSDLINELNGSKKTKKTKKTKQPNINQLQHQMDMKMDAQIDMQSQLQGPSNADTNSQ
ncbi:MAG: penicillin-binding protein 2 [Gammaproteobacteria bacterium CG_4_10_14_0_8_um_filter_38_16]|nr:MAG: penicillin-binding protein 2 [Gammaproteobacteria bacterium CG_4_10_14_0_8_um_filter_38_16]PJA03449.1 MAG: penicillin-binding protein 2 [Gammaproteobacteria bacterium CG_4_10_14_0_2_um_filter_38_22]PJC38681.1 MAG: penicillin-binding protein 2 [Candidatus Peregrinibacteria bacterium CG_4_9_14_0_2_um_filter_38_9]